MSAARRSPAPVTLEHRLLYEAVERLGRNALRRHRLSQGDLDEVVLRYVVAAFQRWPSYRAGAGTPGQWLMGVLRMEVRAFFREQGRFAEGDAAWAEQGETYVPEPRTPLLEQLMTKLTPIEQRIVWLHDAEGHSDREIAFLEGMSKAGVQRIHARAMKKLRREAERAGGTPLVLGLLAAFAAGRDPDPTPAERAQFCERLMARYGARLGITHPSELFADAEADDDPPESGICRSAGNGPPSSGSPKGRWLRVVGPLAGLLLAGTAADATRRGHDQDDAFAATVPAAYAAVPVAAAALAPEGAATAVVMTPAPAPDVRRTGGGYKDRGERERSLRDQWREARTLGDVQTQCSVLAQYAQEFEHGHYAGDRDRLWNETCAQRRRDER